MRVLIVAPLQQDKRIFEEHEKSLDALVTDGVEVDRYYIVNDCDIVPNCPHEVLNTGDLYRKTDSTHVWTQDNLSKMHLLRNRTISAAKDYDYWFSVDTDLVLHPLTLQKLLEADKDIVSEIFWTDGWCNAWMHDQYSAPLPEWREPGLYRVGMTGACTLVKRKVFDAGVNYDPVPNLTLWGEDRHFSIRAAVYGFEMWVDTHYPAEHLYTEKAYKDFMRRRYGNFR